VGGTVCLVLDCQAPEGRGLAAIEEAGL